jgi:hypothetical protein
MSARIVSAEGARSRFLAAESDVRGVLDYYVSVRDALVTVPDDIRERLTVALAELVVGAADAERDAALARVARLERVLAVEQGEETQGPDGWVWGVDLDDETGAVLRYVWAKGAVRIGGMTSEGWSRLRTGTTMPVGKVYDTALEAMEAADAATSAPTPPAEPTAPR